MAFHGTVLPPLQATPDRYGGLLCTVDGFEGRPVAFELVLTRALEEWQAARVRGVWFRVPGMCGDLLRVLLGRGFSLHHTDKDEIMLTRWLPEDEPNMLPGYASAFIGVGGLVINARGELLVIHERYGADDLKRWKLPGGHAHPGERICDAARREVEEETGIRASFESIITMRHNPQYMYNCSDLYVVCLMRPENLDIRVCTDEVSEGCWMGVPEFLSNPDVYNVNKQLVMQCILQCARRIPHIRMFPGELVFNGQRYPYDVFRVDIQSSVSSSSDANLRAAGALLKTSAPEAESVAMDAGAHRSSPAVGKRVRAAHRLSVMCDHLEEEQEVHNLIASPTAVASRRVAEWITRALPNKDGTGYDVASGTASPEGSASFPSSRRQSVSSVIPETSGAAAGTDPSSTSTLASRLDARDDALMMPSFMDDSIVDGWQHDGGHTPEPTLLATSTASLFAGQSLSSSGSSRGQQADSSNAQHCVRGGAGSDPLQLASVSSIDGPPPFAVPPPHATTTSPPPATPPASNVADASTASSPPGLPRGGWGSFLTGAVAGATLAAGAFFVLSNYLRLVQPILRRRR